MFQNLVLVLVSPSLSMRMNKILTKQLHDSVTCTLHNESAGHLLYPVCATSRHPKLQHYIIPCAPEFVQRQKLFTIMAGILHFVSIAQAAITEIYEARDSAFARQSPIDIQLILSFSLINIIIYKSERNFILELFSITQSWYTINQT